MKISIIIPCFDEYKTINSILNKLKILKDFDKEIIIVDDFSTDGTKEILQKIEISNEIKTFFNEKNYGKGYCIRKGIKESSGEIIIIQDADLEYDPTDIKIFLNELEKFNFDLIMGSRFIGTKRSVLHFWHMLGNKFITFLFNFLNNTTFTDIYCCYCLFKKDLINIKDLKCYGWGQQAEILTLAINNKTKLYEIGVNYNGRNYSEGKKIRYHHVFGVIYWMFITKLKKAFK